MKPSECRLRPVTNDDADLVIQLIDNVYREYGETMHLEQADRDLQNLQGAYMERGGSFVVLEQDHEIVGCHATLPVDPAAKLGTLRRLYLAPKLRGQGWGDVLMNWALDWALQAGWDRIEFWSDTRFTRAHQFFRRFQFVKTGVIREMQDSYEPYSEYQYVWSLSYDETQPLLAWESRDRIAEGCPRRVCLQKFARERLRV